MGMFCFCSDQIHTVIIVSFWSEATAGYACMSVMITQTAVDEDDRTCLVHTESVLNTL